MFWNSGTCEEVDCRDILLKNGSNALGEGGVVALWLGAPMAKLLYRL